MCFASSQIEKGTQSNDPFLHSAPLLMHYSVILNIPDILWDIMRARGLNRLASGAAIFHNEMMAAILKLSGTGMSLRCERCQKRRCVRVIWRNTDKCNHQ